MSSTRVVSQKCLVLLALIVGYFLFFSPVIYAATLFSDGFETGFSAWSEAGASWDDINNAAGAYEGSYRAQVVGGNIAAGGLVKLLSTTGYENIALNFKYQIPTANGFEDSDKLEVAYTTDAGATWTTTHEFVDGNEVDSWTNFQIALPASVANSSDFGVRFLLNAPHLSDMFRLDAVLITADEIVVVDEDADNDGVSDIDDNCVAVSNMDQADFDEDGEGDACDTDDDNDGIADVDEVGGCEFNTDASCGVAVDADGDGVIKGDYCPNTTTDAAGSQILNPNHWRYNGVNLVQGVTRTGNSSASIYTMTDTKGCGCDQIIAIFQSYTGYEYKGHQKFGCSEDLMNDFLNLIW